MRQVADTLVWLALIAVVAAVLYFTPRVASFVSSREKDGFHHNGRAGVAWRVVSEPAESVVPAHRGPPLIESHCIASHRRGLVASGGWSSPSSRELLASVRAASPPGSVGSIRIGRDRMGPLRGDPRGSARG